MLRVVSSSFVMVLSVGLVLGVVATGCSGNENSQARKSAERRSQSPDDSQAPDAKVSVVKAQHSDLPAKPRKKSSAEKTVTASDLNDSQANGQDSQQIPADPQERNGNTISLVRQPRKAAAKLPKFFSQIVNQQQREDIDRVQADYRIKIKRLEAELDVLRKAELQDMEQLLTEEQRKLLMKLRSQSTGKRSADSLLRRESEDALDSDDQSPDEPADPSAMDD